MFSYAPPADCFRESAVAFPKGMNGIERRNKARTRRSKIAGRPIAQVAPPLQIGKQPLHFPIDVLRIAEGAFILEQAHRSRPSRPQVNILKQVMMNRAVMGDAQVARRQGFVGAPRRHCRLERPKLGLVADIWNILENRCAWIAVRICYGIVHAQLRFAAIFAGKNTTPLAGRQALAVEFPEVFPEPAARLDALDLAKLGKPIPANRVGAGS